MKKELIYNPFTDKYTNINPNGRTAKKIYKYLIDTGVAPETILPENLTYINNRFRKVKGIIDFSNVRRITKAQVVAAEDSGTARETFLKNIMKNYIGQTIRRIRKYPIVLEDSILMNEDEEIIEIPTAFSSWWRKSEPGFFWIGSDDFLFDRSGGKPEFDPQVLILSYDKVDAQDTNQYFLDGINHCFFHPIKNWGEDALSNAKSKTAMKRYTKFCKDVDIFTDMYSNGVPTEDIQSIVNQLQIKVEIDVPSSLVSKDTDHVVCESHKKPLKTFKFINTRLNHIELNEVSIKNNYEEVENTKDIFNQLKEDNEFFLWKQNKSGQITQINTLHTNYKLIQPADGYVNTINEFEDFYDIQDFKVEHFANKELSEFLLENVNCNQSINFMEDYYEEHDIWEDDTLYKHIDMNRAYTRGDECNYYQGYLGKITDFRKTDKIMGLGIYNIDNVVINNPALEKMNYIHDGNAYPSPELDFFKKNGVSFDITHGCWGSRFDMDFDDGMMKKENENDPKEPRYYSKWYGCLMKLTTKDRYNFDCKDLEFAELSQYCDKDCDIRWNYEDEHALIEYQKTHAYHGSHICAFITSYCRITMMEQIMQFKDLNNIKGVVVDGIYYQGEDDLEISPLFSSDEPKRMKFEGSSGYLPYTSNYYCEGDIGEKRDNNRVELHLGGGGCGKTHYNLKDDGLIAPMFVAPSWKLARNKSKEYGVKSTTFFHITNEDPDKWRNIARYSNVLIIDEVSMLSNAMKQLIINRYTDHKIIFCGDIGYQLPPVKGEEFKITDDIVVIKDKYIINYRCKCDKLKRILEDLRDRLSKKQFCFNNKWKEYYGKKVIDIDEMDYKVNDLIITHTKWAGYESPESFTHRYKDLEKYIVEENTRDYCNGEIIIGSKPKKIKSSLRHGFTIHSIQGETAQEKLYIDLNRMTDLRMFYTAISRAQYWEQIVFVKNNFKGKKCN